MSPIPQPSALLVAIDFSPCSLRALDAALSWRPAGADVTVVHVVDSDLARRLESAGVCAAADAIRRMRDHAEREIEGVARGKKATGGFETMIVEGVPFAEIVKIATDLECDLIVLGSQGERRGLEEVLFGSTAEKVLRAARQPVLCVP